jgi:uncharacterized cupredoxin-like copper-binding protein
MRIRRITGVFAATAALLLVACGGDTETLEARGEERVVRIEALDSLAFEPDQVSVAVGETVRFRVSNPGVSLHEFVLGPEFVQMAHEEASKMGGDHGGHVEGQLAAVNVPSGATEEVVVTFEEPGEVLFGCHEPGHYDGGMVGTVTVT